MFETRIWEIAGDPEAYGLEPDEVYAYRLAAGCYTGSSFVVPPCKNDREALWRLFVDICNCEDDVADDRTVPSDIRRAARSARDSLQALATELLLWRA